MMRPPEEAVLLSRLAFGHTPSELEDVRRKGRKAWIREQLSPPEGDDPETAAILAKAVLPIEYPAGEDGPPESRRRWDAVKEDRPLRTLNQDIKDLWPLRRWQIGMPYQERVRPRDETVAASWIRARHSRFQIREVMTSFWHDHFNVNAMHDDVAVAATWPLYDRMIRRNALGSFRTLLEETAKSPAMLVYLNNRTSKASPANENYARELFELHTLGADCYLNHLYKRWREVPGALKGQPSGYIDQDVYEAARAFTGWTLADGQWGPDGPVPDTGEFYYRESFHDPYQKRILGVEFDANAAPMSDGLKVLDMAAGHPGTARHICSKLVRRLVSDDPPKGLIDRAVKAWREHEKDRDQIAQVVRVIAESDEIIERWGDKAKKPFEWAVSCLRATGGEILHPQALTWWASVMGQNLFGWPTPDGAPDSALPWLGSNSMMGRWNGPFWLGGKDGSPARLDLVSQTPETVKTLGEAAEFWTERILPGEGRGPVAESVKEAVKNWAPLESPLVRPAAEDVLRGMAALAALAPQFNVK